MPVQFVLLLFGFANAGVPFAQSGLARTTCVAALLVGKPLGILLFSAVARLAWRTTARAPGRGSLLVGVVAVNRVYGVALLCDRRISRGAAWHETKMGALSSFIAAPLAMILARAFAIQRG